jgi:hypothetical protein
VSFQVIQGILKYFDMHFIFSKIFLDECVGLSVKLRKIVLISILLELNFLLSKVVVFIHHFKAQLIINLLQGLVLVCLTNIDHIWKYW